MVRNNKKRLKQVTTQSSNKSAKPLTLKQARFVAEYLVDGDGKRSAIAAGYSPQSAKYTAYGLLKHNAGVIDALASSRQAILDSGVYDARAAVSRILAHIDDASTRGNSMAVMKGEELLLRLHGLLIDRLDVRLQTVDIKGAMEEAKARVAGRLELGYAPPHE